MQNISGKTAFITGGASGIGLGIAKALLGQGMKVAIADIRDDHIAEAVAELQGGDDVLALKLDVTDREAFARAADETEAKFGKIHILVNNAGVAALGPAADAAYGDWDWTVGVNLGGTINGVVTILPRILKHGEGGHIVSTASMSGMIPHPGAVTYVTSKAAVTAMMESMRGELEGQGVICSAFCPGAVQSNIAEAGKTRPEKYAETGYEQSDKARQSAGDFSHLFMTKEEVGERVLEGILNDELYIMTHAEFYDGVKDRGAAMLAAVPAKRPINEEYRATFAPLFHNPIHPAEVERQAKLKG
ncbi:SDR family NAD(P)-dependent oxidoreductase [Altericroceibacterium endophyticum]|uniref:SDR family NAD(P)-dependent oxidoreductase n=1 Tax=Altericroceibacterium endophyticum TaxID=1808508 RepID=A0A6I4T5V7_9SPHN|nr:SDR family NAD(P)-dependent oxidoreductase [Altericroceibacterium endophyticum]MXO65175.1 SDR family NAD(P)-dependent oxidoreductase [Altericroceibacterium endophyticum]